MKLVKKILKLILISGCLISVELSQAGEIRIAVASNFTNTIKTLSKHYEDKTGHKVILIFGATGKHYAQIKNGAPFDIFFAADSKRPKLLENEGLIFESQRFTYALGKLVLWSPKDNFTDSQAKVLEKGDFYHIALANPKLAPYGRAAYEVLKKNHLWELLKTKAVRGENIGQTFQFVKSGNAELGFVALAQIKHLNEDEKGSFWNIPESLYNPIKQQVVLLNNNPIAKDFMTFIKTDTAREIIKSFGYGLPINNSK